MGGILGALLVIIVVALIFYRLGNKRGAVLISADQRTSSQANGKSDERSNETHAANLGNNEPADIDVGGRLRSSNKDAAGGRLGPSTIINFT